MSVPHIPACILASVSMKSTPISVTVPLATPGYIVKQVRDIIELVNIKARPQMSFLFVDPWHAVSYILVPTCLCT